MHSTLFRAAALVAATIGAIGSISASPAAAQGPGEQPPAIVSITQVKRQSIKIEKTFVGTVQAARKAIIGSAVDGRVEDFPLNEGDAVKAKQAVAQLLTKTIEAEIATAEAQWDIRKHELTELKNGTRKEELEAAIARSDAALAIAENAINRRKRVEELARRGQATPGEIDEAVATADQLLKLHVAAKATRALAEAGPRQEQIDQATARAKAAEYDVERLRDMMAKYTIRAPFDGYISAEHTEVGEWVNKGAPIVEVVELKEVEIEAMVLETYIGGMRLGVEAKVEVGAYPGRAFTGEIKRIVPQADVKSRSFPVKIRVVNEESDGQPMLKAGMFARLTLPVESSPDAVVVPKDAIVLGGEKPMVYVVAVASAAGREMVGQMGDATPVPVELGLATGSSYEVRGDIKPGQWVVVKGNERIRPGQKAMIKSVVN
ncbi:MAG: efflux RND transporter periplasmic adaptor subunit [Pirellulales bacterium]